MKKGDHLVAFYVFRNLVASNFTTSPEHNPIYTFALP